MVLGLVVGLMGCTASPSPTGGTRTTPDADATVAALTSGLTDFKLDGVPMFHATADAQADLTETTRGLGGFRPKVTAGEVVYDGTAASVPLTYTFAVATKSWTYESQASMVLVGSEWKVDWQPNIVHPQLTSTSRLTVIRDTPTRAPINGATGLALMEETPVTRIGLDKANMDAKDFESSARKLAKILKINQDDYAERVLASGDQAFVVAYTTRKGDLPPQVTSVPGIYLQDSTAILAPTSTFAVGLLGVTGEATAEIIEKSDGAVAAGDIVGLTGMQQRHDEQLRGTPGYTIQLTYREGEPSESIESAPPASSSPSPTVELPQTLFEVAPVGGKPINTTINEDMQFKAEKALKDVKGVASLVVMSTKDGSILAAANSPDSDANAYATTGAYPPGSTFKIVTTLALLRHGLTPDSLVNCTETYTVNGRSFPNYEGYPEIGKVPLKSAFAHSCNTAFMRASEELSNQELSEAAASLGLGVDYNPGFASYYGLVPSEDNAIAKAAGMIGQGQVTASPMAMAGVVTSVAGGKSVVPWLVEGNQPVAKAKPLTAGEAATLRDMMKLVVSEGTAKSLKGVVTGAKTGTAQFGAEAPYKWHAWMVAWKGDVAVCAFVYSGKSGSATAGPIVKEFFS